jgi:hypothetical protein
MISGPGFLAPERSRWLYCADKGILIPLSAFTPTIALIAWFSRFATSAESKRQKAQSVNGFATMNREIIA